MNARHLRRVLATSSLLPLTLCVTAAFAQVGRVSPIGTPISGGSGSAPASTLLAPRPQILPGTLVVPDSSKINAADLGKKVHTNFIYVMPGIANPLEAPPYSGYAYETPTSLGCVYHLSAVVTGCNPNTVTAVIGGGSQSIAIVDAFDDPEAAADLAYFSDQFGMPFSVSKFQVIYADGVQPAIDYTGGWELEESLDIEYAHAMAPNAKLYLVEASDNSFSSLETAVYVATNLIQCGSSSPVKGFCTTATGKGEVSMSWGGSEFSGETAMDPDFNATNVAFFASSGDSPGTIYPSASPNVVSVGGTSIGRSLTTGNYNYEVGWDDAGSGLSSYETTPSYQNANAAVKAIVGTRRGTPDVAADANPYTGVWVYDTMPFDGFFYSSGWWIVGGTSVASPVWAGIVNKAGVNNGFATSSNAELTRLYTNLGNSTAYAANFHDVTYGLCYFYLGYRDVAGYDLCTGLGSPVSLGGK
jgi:subtilase family serine protease